MHWNPVPAAILKRPPSLVLYTVYTTVCQLLLLQHQQRNRCTSQISLKNSERTSGTMLAISWEPSTKEIITGGAEVTLLCCFYKHVCTCQFLLSTVKRDYFSTFIILPLTKCVVHVTLTYTVHLLLMVTDDQSEIDFCQLLMSMYCTSDLQISSFEFRLILSGTTTPTHNSGNDVECLNQYC